jgi:protein-S-isoprenylcysteine O-methyltransferase Ste14
MKGLRGVGFLITTNLLYLGIPLFGWGLDDLPGFFSKNQRLGYGLLILVLGLAVGYQAIETPEGIRGSRGQEGKVVARQSIIRVVAVLILLGALAFLPFSDRRGIGVLTDNQMVRWVGLVLFAAGMGLVYWSGIALGRLYSAEVTIQQGHHLVTRGPYRHVRHPRYLGAVLLGPGLSLTFRSWIGLIASFAFVGFILLRIRDEEALMHAEFGQEWEEYCQRTWRLIPLVY